jgi:hypothetical protein
VKRGRVNVESFFAVGMIGVVGIELLYMLQLWAMLTGSVGLHQTRIV